MEGRVGLSVCGISLANLDDICRYESIYGFVPRANQFHIILWGYLLSVHYHLAKMTGYWCYIRRPLHFSIYYYRHPWTRLQAPVGLQWCRQYRKAISFCRRDKILPSMRLVPSDRLFLIVSTLSVHTIAMDCAWTAAIFYAPIPRILVVLPNAFLRRRNSCLFRAMPCAGIHRRAMTLSLSRVARQ